MSSLDGKDGKASKDGKTPSSNEDVMGLDDGGDEKKLKLVSQDGDKFEVTKKVAVQSELVKTMAEGDKEENEIPLPNVKASVLKKVVEYMRYHVDNPAREIEKPLKSANMVEVVSQWDAGQQQHDVPPRILLDLLSPPLLLLSLSPPSAPHVSLPCLYAVLCCV
jgi:hypothetical protein